LQKRVRRGVQFLDEVKPGWGERIDLARLDMLHTRLCLCGQLYGRYKNAERVLHMSPADSVLRVHSGPRRLRQGCMYIPQDVLTKLWTKEIKKWRSVADSPETDEILKRMNPVGSESRKLPTDQ